MMLYPFCGAPPRRDNGLSPNTNGMVPNAGSTGCRAKPCTIGHAWVWQLPSALQALRTFALRAGELGAWLEAVVRRVPFAPGIANAGGRGTENNVLNAHRMGSVWGVLISHTVLLLQAAMSPITIDLLDPDILIFDEQPELFVRLDTVPVVFTVRGLRYFTPRFKMIGVNIATLRTQAQFRAALLEARTHEHALLIESFQSKANATHQANEHQVLLAALMGDIDAAEAAMDRLEHKRRAGLTVVPPLGLAP